MSDALKDFAVKALNLTDDQFAAIVYADDKTTIKDNALDELLKLDAERIKNARQVAKDRETELHDKGYKKAQAETLTKFETELREEFGITTDSKGKDLVKEIVGKMAKDTGMTEEQVKLHPKYLELERALKDKYVSKEEYEKVSTDFEGFKSKVERDKVMYSVKSDALKVFRALNPVLPADLTKAANLENKFLQEFDSFEYEIQQDGSHIIKIDGKRLENSQGHPVSFPDFVKQRAEMYFDFKKQNDKGNAGNNGGGSGGGSVTVPQTKEEYLAAIANETDPKKAVEITRLWKEKNK